MANSIERREWLLAHLHAAMPHAISPDELVSLLQEEFRVPDARDDLASFLRWPGMRRTQEGIMLVPVPSQAPFGVHPVLARTLTRWEVYRLLRHWGPTCFSEIVQGLALPHGLILTALDDLVEQKRVWQRAELWCP